MSDPIDPDEPDDRTVDHATRHWAGVGTVVVLLVGGALATREPVLALAAGLGVTYAGYARLAITPSVRDPETGDPVLSVDREFDDESPDSGDEVTVTVTVQNRGLGLLTDVRLADGVPPELNVVDDTPRHGAVLFPGGESTFSYAVRAVRGEFEWRPARVAVADPSGAVERETRVGERSTLACSLPPFDAPRRQLPLRALTARYPGRIETDTGGTGIDFHSAREYRTTDSRARVDWHRLARTGELATVEFREERLARVMLVVDTREAAYLAAAPTDEHAVERSVDAAHRLFVALLDTGNRVGIAGFGPAGTDCWLPPRAGNEHRNRGRHLLSTHPTFSPHPPGQDPSEQLRDERGETLRERRVRRLHERLPRDTQVIFLSPCGDEYVPSIARRLEAYGNPVTVISPDPTSEETPAEALSQFERRDRLADLRKRGIRVVDWEASASFERAVARAQGRWSA